MNTGIYRTGAIELRWVTNIDKNDYISVRNNWIEKILFMKIDHWSQSTLTLTIKTLILLYLLVLLIYDKSQWMDLLEENWESNVWTLFSQMALISSQRKIENIIFQV